MTTKKPKQKEKSLLVKLGLFGIIFFLWFPTGTPDDLVTTAPIILLIGLTAYVTISILLAVLFLSWVIWRFV
jgi:hypothetical protein